MDIFLKTNLEQTTIYSRILWFSLPRLYYTALLNRTSGTLAIGLKFEAE